VEIRAEAAEVFSLVSDLRRKAALNPTIKVIRVELEGQQTIGEGSVFYHRIQRGMRIVEYRSRCLRYVPPYHFQTRSETNPPFEVTVAVEPTPCACLLTQREVLEVTPEMLDALEPPEAKGGPFREVVRLVSLFPGTRQLESELRAHQRERLKRRLTRELRAWLDAIKAYIESQNSHAV
jgi:hypothetical protein